MLRRQRRDVSRSSDEYVPHAYWTELLGRECSSRGVAYPHLPEVFNEFIYRAFERSLERVLRAAGVPPRVAVLDVGFGTGNWIDFWIRRGAHRVEGVDFTEAAVASTAARFPNVALHHGDIAELPPPVARVDIVSAMSVLLHIVDPERFRCALANIRDRLGPGGWFVAIEPVVVHHWWGPAFDAGSNSLARPLVEWKSALDAADFELVALRPATCLLANPVDTRSRLAFLALSLYWQLLGELVGESPARARFVGLPLSAVDRALSTAIPHGPSAKVLLARSR